MLKPEQKNSYQEFLRKKNKFAKKIRQGKKFKDTDCDGLCDYEEKRIYGTNPKNPDTDGDGMSDGQEVNMGRNPLGSGRFKDLFIPHAGNDYTPQVLKPKRLLFHALSVIAIKLVVVVFVLFYPLSAWLSPDMASAESKKIIELTNGLRQAVSLPALLDNRQLALAAWQKVEDMAVNQYFAHINPSGAGLKNWLNKVGYKYSVAGENLAVGFSNASEVVAAWKNSPTHYRNIIDGDFKEIGVALADGKFSQIDTVYIAQYFGAPGAANPPNAQSSPVKKPQQTAAESVKPSTDKSAPETGVKGVSIAEIEFKPEASSENEMINQESAALAIKAGQFDKEKAMQISIFLPENTVSAEVFVDSKIINLNKKSDQANEWSGAAIISQTEEKKLMNPLISASIAVKDSAGTVSYGKIDWDEIKFIKTPALERYRLFKANPASAMKPILNLSGLYFKLILLVATIAMLLNIFIEIKKQRPHIIFYSFAFIILLLGIIIF